MHVCWSLIGVVKLIFRFLFTAHYFLIIFFYFCDAGEYGFIGEYLIEDSVPCLKVRAYTFAKKTYEYKNFNLQELGSKFPHGKFTNFNTLFGDVIKFKTTLLTNDAQHHPSATRGFPPCHPPLVCKIAIAIQNLLT